MHKHTRARTYANIYAHSHIHRRFITFPWHLLGPFTTHLRIHTASQYLHFNTYTQTFWHLLDLFFAQPTMCVHTLQANTYTNIRTPRTHIYTVTHTIYTVLFGTLYAAPLGPLPLTHLRTHNASQYLHLAYVFLYILCRSIREEMK